MERKRKPYISRTRRHRRKIIREVQRLYGIGARSWTEIATALNSASVLVSDTVQDCGPWTPERIQHLCLAQGVKMRNIRPKTERVLAPRFETVEQLALPEKPISIVELIISSQLAESDKIRVLQKLIE